MPMHMIEPRAVRCLAVPRMVLQLLKLSDAPTLRTSVLDAVRADSVYIRENVPLARHVLTRLRPLHSQAAFRTP